MLGPWVNSAKLNAVATVIVAVLLMLSGILVVTTAFPGVNVTRLLLGLSSVLVLALVGLGIVTLRSRNDSSTDQTLQSTVTERRASSGTVIAVPTHTRWAEQD